MLSRQIELSMVSDLVIALYVYGINVLKPERSCISLQHGKAGLGY